MDISVKQQIVLFLCSALAGMFTGVVFDFIRVIRNEVKLKGLKSLLDLIFVAAAGSILFGFLFFVNGIQLRFFIIFGLILGNIVYFMTLTRVFGFVFKINFKIFKFFLQKLLQPVILLCIILRKMATCVGAMLIKIKKALFKKICNDKKILDCFKKRVKRV